MKMVSRPAYFAVVGTPKGVPDSCRKAAIAESWDLLRPTNQDSKTTAKHMNEPLYETNFWGTRTVVFPTHISQRTTFLGFKGPEVTIALRQIVGIEVGTRFALKVQIATSGGKKYSLYMRVADREAFRDAVYSAMKNVA